MVDRATDNKKKAKNLKLQSFDFTLADGSVRQFKVTLNTLALLEEQFGSVDAAFEKLSKASIITIRYFLWAGIYKGKDDTITVEDIGDVLSMTDVATYMQKIGEILTASMPDAEESDPNDEEAQ